MTALERTFQVFLDQFFQEYTTVLGQVYASFLLKQFDVQVKGRVINLPTVLLHKDPLETDSDGLDKLIPDCLYKLHTKAAGEFSFRKTVLQVEHQHRNQVDLHYRMTNYYNAETQRYRGYAVSQILVYTGDYKFNSPTELLCRINSNKYWVVDLTQLDPTEFTNDPHFGIQFLCIFSHIMPEREKIRFLVEGFKAFYKKYGRKNTQFYIDLLPLAMTKRNSSAINAITAALSFEPEFKEMIKLSPYYAKVWEEAEEKGKEKGKEEGKEEGMEKGMEQGMEKGMEQGKIASALAFIRKGKLSIEEVAETLELTAAEIALLQQPSNGNGKHD
jgi:hypothetical protein